MKRKYLHKGGNIIRNIKNRWRNVNPKTKRIIKGVAGTVAGLATLYGAYRGAKHLGVVKYPGETNASLIKRRQYWADKTNLALGRPIGPAIPGPHNIQRVFRARRPSPPEPSFVSQILL